MTSADQNDDKDGRKLSEQHLCFRCVDEPYLRAEIKRDGLHDKCDYCGKAGATFSIGEMADYIEDAFERHFITTPTEPSPLEYTMIKESDYSWDREGESAENAIASAAIIEEEPAEDIRQVLANRHYDIELAQMGEESPFDDEAHYTEKDPDDIELRETWRYFENSLKTEARFFSANVEATLETVFQGLHEHKKHDDTPIIVEAGPDTTLTGIYRARVFQSNDKLEEALKYPEKHLGPPPPELTVAGRMNARGISVFYGATDPDLAVGEVRPPVGSRVAVARFVFLRSARFLDVRALRSVYVEGSIFDTEYLGRLELAKFLERLSDRFAMPVMPDDEPLDYLPTQAIAEYLSARIDPPLDGILYPSVQGEETPKEVNLALFHKSSCVTPSNLPDGTEIQVMSGMHTEDGWEEHYFVWENDSTIEPESEQQDSDFPILDTITAAPFALDDDLRDPMLQLDSASLQVHHIQAAKYETHAHTVRRYKKDNRRS